MKSNVMTIELTFYCGGQYPSFHSLNVHVSGNGILKLDWENTPYGVLRSKVNYLMDRALEAVEKTDEARRLSETQEKNQDAEKSAHQILDNLGINHAS